MKCLFCSIMRKEKPASVVYEDEHILCFRDIMPQAPVHCLIIPKLHFPGILEAGEKEMAALSHLMAKIPQIARDLGLDSFRLVNNCGETAGQSVWHFHIHILGGRSFGWPPG